MPVERHSPDCFVCGFLGVDVRVGAEAGGPGHAAADLLLDHRFTGPPGMVHGGAIAAVFDELLGAAVLDLTPRAFTAHLEIDYRAPWPLGTAARMTAVVAWLGERKLDARAELRTADAAGTLLCEARGLWIVPRG